MGSTYERSFLKGFVWEFISFFIALCVAYLYYGNLGNSLIFALWLTVIKVPLFFIHERIWKQIKWGKIKDRR